MSTQLVHMVGADLYMGDASFTLEPTHHGPVCRIKPPLMAIERVEVWLKETTPAAWTLVQPLDTHEFPGQPPVRPITWEKVTYAGSPAIQVYCDDAFTETVSFKIWGRQ